MAEACDFYILLLGARYGHEIASGISATEAEFDRAVQVNPTKILVFRNSSVAPEPKQKKFITKVSDYYKGYWVAEYQNTLDLQNLVNDSFLSLLKERAAIGSRLMHVDHFIRLAIQRRPVSDAVVYYSVTCDNIELTYECYGCTHHIQFTRARVSSDFWGSVSELETQFRKWR
jgi:hypothetical protein